MAKKKLTVIEELINLYKNTQEKISNAITGENTNKNAGKYQEELFKKIGKEIEELNNYTGDWTIKNLPKYYTKSSLATDNKLKKEGADLEKSVVNISRNIHRSSITRIIDTVKRGFVEINNFANKNLKDNITNAILKAREENTDQALITKAAKEIITNTIIDQNNISIRKKNGSNIKLAYNAELIARNAVKETTTTALLNKMQERGFDLVKMSTTLITCPICIVLEGRIYSISGENPDFPALDNAYSSGHANIHPNCKHYLIPYFPDNEIEYEVDKKVSNREFKINKRDKKRLEVYEETQRKKSKIRYERNKYDDYVMMLGDEAPSTFQGYMKMKNSNSEKWKELKRKYLQMKNEKLVI